MKKILFLLIMLPLLCHGQENNLDINTNELVIIKDCNIEKNRKFSNAKEWVAKTFGDYKSVIQYEDKQECKIIIKGKSPLKNEEHSAINDILNVRIIPSLNYTITIECKDEKYRFIMDGISVDVEQISYILGSPSVDTNSYSIKEFITQTVDGEISNSDELLKNTINKLDLASIKLDSLRSIDSSVLKKKEQKKLLDLINSEEKNIRLYRKDITEYEYWLSKEERRMEDIRSKIMLLHSSLTQYICKSVEW